ncbi:MAG: MEMO1 family protein [Methanothrix sp.]|nr:MEMO1 family protein [Methanothrix sp.]
MRLAAVAGQFYLGRGVELEHQLDGMLHPEKELPVLGAVVPHAGYIYSGQVAAAVYSCLPKAETYVIIGPNHHGLGSPVALSRDSWKTPLGVVESDGDMADALAGSIIDHDETAHLHEHSIEVQLPFLQRRFQGFKILPICMGLQDEETAAEVGREISRAIEMLHRRCVIIASSDFTHYEPQETARSVDTRLLEAILNMDVPELYSRVRRYDASACGYGPIAATITASAALGAKAGRLQAYATSGDVSGDYNQVVGYGAVVFF